MGEVSRPTLLMHIFEVKVMPKTFATFLQIDTPKQINKSASITHAQNTPKANSLPISSNSLADNSILGLSPHLRTHHR